jgi:hypothetical protein
MNLRWRVGTKLGRTLYLDNKVVGMVDTVELAAEIVAAMNAVYSSSDTSTPSVVGEKPCHHKRKYGIVAGECRIICGTCGELMCGDCNGKRWVATYAGRHMVGEKRPCKRCNETGITKE